jgi:hypothetical protein
MLMPLGRTANAIKIKTDDGGLRAVNCACCSTCGCAVSLPQSIKTLADNATAESFSFNGVFAESENFERSGPDEWYALFFLGFGTEIYYSNGCLQFYYSYVSPAPESGLGFAETGNPEECAFPLGSSTVTGNFTINGITGFDYFYYTDEGQIPVPPPVIVFS